MSGDARVIELIDTLYEAIRYLRAYFDEKDKYNISVVEDITTAAAAVAEILSWTTPPVLELSAFEEGGTRADEALNRLKNWLADIDYVQRDMKRRLPEVPREMMNAVRGKGDLMAAFRLEPTERIETRKDIVADIIRGKNIIHLGCTDHIPFIDEKIKKGTFFHLQLMKVADKCLGVDINTEAVEYLKTLGFDNVIYGDITVPGIAEITRENWDYIVLGEVLEHVDNPVAFLEAISANYKQNVRRFIITAPNAFCLQSAVYTHNYGTEVINADHKYWFTPYTLCNVAYRAGLKPENMRMCAYGGTDGFIKKNYDGLLTKPLLLETIVLEGEL